LAVEWVGIFINSFSLTQFYSLDYSEHSSNMCYTVSSTPSCNCGK